MSDETPQCEEKMYHLICKERFDHIDVGQQQIIDLLRGKNSAPGLIDEVRVLKARWNIIFGAMVIIFGALVTQLVHWILRIT